MPIVSIENLTAAYAKLNASQNYEFKSEYAKDLLENTVEQLGALISLEEYRQGLKTPPKEETE